MTQIVPTLNLRSDELKHSATFMFSKHFPESSTPNFIIRAGAADQEEYTGEDDDHRLRKQNKKLFLRTLEQIDKLLDETFGHGAYKMYSVSFPESGFEQQIFVINAVSDNIVIEACVSDSATPTFTILSKYKSFLFERLSELLAKVKRPKSRKADEIHIIGVSGSSFYLTDIDLKKRKIAFSYDNYNEDFEPVSKQVIKALRADNASGLVLFHGGVGTGKTSYMKYLLNQINNKKIIYVPPDMVEHLASPSFVSFLIEEAKNSILLIEDAETVLQKRAAGQAQSVSNILNISDGILGDILQMQIVCTFNCDVNTIDPALLRPGRLIAEYRFDKLQEGRATAVLQKLYGSNVSTQIPLSLAEIYAYQTMPTRSSK